MGRIIISGMKTIRASKCYLYTTSEQESLYARVDGCVRLVWNKARVLHPLDFPDLLLIKKG